MKLNWIMHGNYLKSDGKAKRKKVWLGSSSSGAAAKTEGGMLAAAHLGFQIRTTLWSLGTGILSSTPPKRIDSALEFF
jgi:hypothetical protein